MAHCFQSLRSPFLTRCFHMGVSPAPLKATLASRYEQRGPQGAALSPSSRLWARCRLTVETAPTTLTTTTQSGPATWDHPTPLPAPISCRTASPRPTRPVTLKRTSSTQQATRRYRRTNAVSRRSCATSRSACPELRTMEARSCSSANARWPTRGDEGSPLERHPQPPGYRARCPGRDPDVAVGALQVVGVEQVLDVEVERDLRG